MVEYLTLGTLDSRKKKINQFPPPMIWSISMGALCDAPSGQRITMEGGHECQVMRQTFPLSDATLGLEYCLVE